mmetsp:Transcript_16061/g.39574  ORF Transcript_16061/g.39574 Transcript_16061/m.39574 type:complete len:251 (-) Transcript_16061:1503-2255(-)
MPRSSGRAKAGRKALGLGEDANDAIVVNEPEPGYDDDDMYKPQTTQEKIESTRGNIEDTNDRTVGMLDDAIHIGANTNAKLARQGEQLNRGRQDLDEVKENTDYANEHLSKMEMCCCVAIIVSCCCCCCQKNAAKPVRKVKDYRDEKREKGRQNGRNAVADNMEKVSKAKRDLNRAQASPHEDDAAKHEAVFDAQLDVMTGQLGVLAELAKEQGTELEHQKGIIRGLDNSVGARKAEVRAADRRAAALLH